MLLEIIKRADVMHAELLRQIDGLMNAGAATPEADQLSRLADIVSAYEDMRYPVGFPKEGIKCEQPS